MKIEIGKYYRIRQGKCFIQPTYHAESSYGFLCKYWSRDTNGKVIYSESSWIPYYHADNIVDCEITEEEFFMEML